jgi:hypothetical protein
MPQPNSGRINRSPGAVERRIQIDSLMSCSISDMATRPVVVSIRTGNFHPRPRNDFGITRLSNQYRWLSEKNRVWRACFNHLIALARGGQPVDQDARAADGNNAADMWLHSVD